MLNICSLDYMPLDIDEDETCYNKCKYYIKRTCLATTIIINFLFFLLNLYIILPSITDYFDDKIFGFWFFIGIEIIFIITSSFICWYII